MVAMTIRQAAAELGVSERRVLQLVKAGKLGGKRVEGGGRYGYSWRLSGAAVAREKQRLEKSVAAQAARRRWAKERGEG